MLHINLSNLMVVLDRGVCAGHVHVIQEAHPTPALY